MELKDFRIEIYQQITFVDPRQPLWLTTSGGKSISRKEHPTKRNLQIQILYKDAPFDAHQLARHGLSFVLFYVLAR